MRHEARCRKQDARSKQLRLILKAPTPLPFSRYASFVIRHPSFVIRHLPFAIRHSPFVIRHSPFAIRHSYEIH